MVGSCGGYCGATPPEYITMATMVGASAGSAGIAAGGGLLKCGDLLLGPGRRAHRREGRCVGDTWVPRNWHRAAARLGKPTKPGCIKRRQRERIGKGAAGTRATRRSLTGGRDQIGGSFASKCGAVGGVAVLQRATPQRGGVGTAQSSHRTSAGQGEGPGRFPPAGRGPGPTGRGCGRMEWVTPSPRRRRRRRRAAPGPG
jgi:hypothetical protein